MNRRSFFNRAANFVAGCALGIGIKLNSPKILSESQPELEAIYETHPEWEDAPYEMIFLMDNGERLNSSVRFRPIL